MAKKVFVTGGAGFIGMHVVQRLVDDGYEVVTVDNYNSLVYPKEIKYSRAETLKRIGVDIVEMDILDLEKVKELTKGCDAIIHLAAYGGVRNSLLYPGEYARNNIETTINIFEAARINEIHNVLYASSSSVYGGSKEFPLHEELTVDNPISPYAASKRCNEICANAYANLYKISLSGMRFFTVYGPWGRPDMALSIFTRKMLGREPIDVFGHGQMQRDFTYIDDIVEGIIGIMENPIEEGGSRVFNIARGEVVELMRYIEVLAENLGAEPEYNMMPMQPGDAPRTDASINVLNSLCGYQPKVSVDEGVKNFVEWYKEFYEVG